MDDKTYIRIIVTVTFVGVLSVLVLLGYTFELYRHCSILSYIANRG